MRFLQFLSENRVYLSECYEKGSVVYPLIRVFSPESNGKIRPEYSLDDTCSKRKFTLWYLGDIKRANLYCVNHLNGKVLWKDCDLER